MKIRNFQVLMIHLYIYILFIFIDHIEVDYDRIRSAFSAMAGYGQKDANLISFGQLHHALNKATRKRRRLNLT